MHQHHSQNTLWWTFIIKFLTLRCLCFCTRFFFSLQIKVKILFIGLHAFWIWLVKMDACWMYHIVWLYHNHVVHHTKICVPYFCLLLEQLPIFGLFVHTDIYINALTWGLILEFIARVSMSACHLLNPCLKRFYTVFIHHVHFGIISAEIFHKWQLLVKI